MIDVNSLNNKKMRILLCGAETAGLMSTIFDGFQRNGHHVKAIGKSLVKHWYGSILDCEPENLEPQERIEYFNNCVDWADMVVYISASAFFVHPEYDYKKIKETGKPLCVYATGSDTRIYATHIKLLKKLHKNFNSQELINRCSADPAASYFLGLMEKYADVIISAPDQSYHSTREFYIGYQPVNMDGIGSRQPNFSSRKLAHVPSTEIKGTSEFLQTVKDIMITVTGGAMEFMLARNYSHKEFLQKLCQHDIYLDELYFFNHGIASVEAMCSGLISVTGDNFDICPMPERKVWPVVTGNLKERLLELLLMPMRDFENLSSEVMQFARTNHDHLKVCANMLSLIESGHADGFTKARDVLTVAAG
jgi:hypothetical protein